MSETAAAKMVAAAPSEASASSSAYQMPISFLKRDESGTIVKIRGKEDMRHHLESIGFVEGAKVKVINEIAGDLIVEVLGTQVAINKQVASHIIVS